jgi:chromosome segregation ATPase|tara:strand:+ start:1667 stop:2539 length:873 start_codon:yes stop_codon:yes gene_type:complete
MKVTLAALEKENKRLVSTSKELEKGLENARLAKETAEAVLDPLRVELAASKQSQKEHETKAEQAAVAAEVAAADATDARAALGTLHRVRAELEEARAETVTAKKTLVQKDKEIGAELRETQRRLAEWCAAAATTDSELESCKKQLSETQSELVKLRQSVDGIKKKRASAEIDAADAHASFQSAREKLSALEKNVESVSTELIATKEALAQANSLTDQLTQQAKVAKTENDTITNSVADLEMILEEAVGRAEEETARRHELELEVRRGHFPNPSDCFADCSEYLLIHITKD